MICKRPVNSLFINSNGGLRPDPRYDNDIDNIDNYNDLSEYLISNKLKEIQRHIITDENCKDCINISKQSSFSTMDTTNDVLTTLFLGVSNICNFECIMCGSFASHKLIDRDKKLFNLNFDLQHSPDLKIKKLSSSQLKKIFQNINVFSSLKTIKISGGEPFMDNTNFLILEKLLPFSKNINLQIITNGSILPNNDQLRILNNYKSVTITIGLEAIGSVYEYIRKNSIWNDIEKNISIFSKLFNVRFFVSLNAISIFNMDELLNFIDDKDTSFQTITKPNYLSHTIFGNALEEIYPKKLLGYVPSHEKNSTSILKFFSYIDFIDDYYQSSLLKIQPRFKDFI